jgi:hypothetical protein
MQWETAKFKTKLKANKKQRQSDACSHAWCAFYRAADDDDDDGRKVAMMMDVN